MSRFWIWAAASLAVIAASVVWAAAGKITENQRDRARLYAMLDDLIHTGRTCQPDLWQTVGQMGVAEGVRAIYWHYDAPVPPYGAPWDTSIQGAIDLMRCGA